jgi:predicted transcriptional regulator
VARLGDLERAVMDVLWAADPQSVDGMTVRQVAEALSDRAPAYTTVMTVLDRLAGKQMVVRQRDGRAWRYRPAASREAYVAQLMLDALDLAEPAQDTGGRGAALIRFARSVTGEEAQLLRAALEEQASAAGPERPHRRRRSRGKG